MEGSYQGRRKLIWNTGLVGYCAKARSRAINRSRADSLTWMIYVVYERFQDLKPGRPGREVGQED